MPTTTTTYSFNKPVVGADEDDWGGYLNGNWDSVDNLLDGTTPVTGIDINSGTLDGVTIGGTTAGAGTFTTLTANTSITGTLATAAQPNITSVGSLTSLDVGGTVTADGVQSTDGDIKVTTSSSFVGFNSQRAGVPSAGGYQLGRLNFDAYSTGTTFVSGASIQSFSDGAAWTSSSTPAYLSFQTTPSGSTSLKERIKVANNGDISFYEDTGTTAKFFWDASAESLGIGTSSPSAPLSVTYGGGAVGAQITGNASYAQMQLSAAGVSTNAYFTFGANGTGKGIIQRNAVDVITIDSSANVGIGTSSPATTLTVEGSGANGIELNRNGADATQSARLFFDSSTSGYAITNVAGALTFNSGATAGSSSGSERMRIDSSGNLLVGTTSNATWETTAGHVIRPNSSYTATRDGAHALIVNRLTSDGDIAVFAKDGTTVGSIGTLNRLTIGNASSGISFNSSTVAVQPHNMSTNLAADGTVSLGVSGARFKDLYLSGGVYLGGTGAANKLDDYEEGTWTPTLSASTTAPTVSSYGDRVGRYVKVGRMVTAMCQLRANLSSAGSGYPIVTGLPFASQNIYFMGASVGLQNLFTTTPEEGFIGFQGTSVRFDNATYQTGVLNYVCFNITYEHD